MDFSLTEEQTLLRDSARRFLSERGAAAKPSASLWPDFAELGWLGLIVPEAHGGMGLGAVEVAIIAEELGRQCVVEPWVATAVLAAELLGTGEPSGDRAAQLAGIINGTIRSAVAHVEKPARGCLSHVGTRATRNGTGWVVDGEKVAVIGGASATHFLVSARYDGEMRGTAGIAVHLIPRATEGLIAANHKAVDGSEMCNLILQHVEVGSDTVLNHEAFTAIESAVQSALAAWCAEAVGAMDALLQATIAYTTTRVQFGRPLAANQVVRHRLADMAIALEEARSLALKASLADSDRDRAVAAAMVKVGRSARYVSEQAVQLHGAMGVTDELRIGSYFRRLLALSAFYGSPEEHLRRHVRLAAHGGNAIEGRRA